MHSSLELISKEFGFKIKTSEPRKSTGVRLCVSKMRKVITHLGSRLGKPPPYSPPVHQPMVLPPELLDHIIDYLHDDRQALRNCSLVCHALVPSARFHLFQEVKVDHSNFVRATSIFVGSTSHLAEYVRDLSFKLGTPRGGSSLAHLRTLLDKGEIPVHLRVFTLVLSPRMRNVTRLLLQDVPFDNRIVAMLAPNFPQLRSLLLYDCWFHYDTDCDILLKDHPLIRNIRCGRLSSLFSSALTNDSPDVDGARTVPLRSLRIEEAYSESPRTLIPWLVTRTDPEEYAYMLYGLRQAAVEFDNLINFPSLRHLHIIFDRWCTEDIQAVRDTPAVLSLIPPYPPTITMLTLNSGMHFALLAVTVLGWLDPHAFVRLHTVNILLHLSEEVVTEVALVTWAEMDQTLSVLLSLGAVNIFNTCMEESCAATGKRAVLERLPVLNVRGVLKFGQWQRSRFLYGL